MSLLLSTDTFAANKCQPYKDKLLNIQRLQKEGHSAKQSVRFHQQEQKAWQTWMDCKKGKLKRKSKRKKGSSKQVSNKALKVKPQKIIRLNPGSAFENKQGVVVKGKYSGKKQQAWLNFYQPLAKCRKPKSTQTFAFCLNDREKQQHLFETQYLKD